MHRHILKYLICFCTYFPFLYLGHATRCDCEHVNENGLSVSLSLSEKSFNFNNENNSKDKQFGCCRSRFKFRGTCGNPTFVEYASRIFQEPSRRSTLSGFTQDLWGEMGDQRQRTGAEDVACDDVITRSVTVTSLAVVPYNDEKILPHEKPSRNFTIGDFKFHIDQKWAQLGVAAVVWDAAEVLAKYLHQHPYLVQGKRVLELGAGTGLTGLLAAALGGAVTVTERHEAMEHLISSVKNNSAETQWDIEAKELDWTKLPDKESFGHFEVVLGADVIYIEDTFSDLLKTIETFSEDANTLVLLSCRIRYERDRRFLKLLENNFHVAEIFYQPDRDIRIFSARRKV